MTDSVKNAMLDTNVARNAFSRRHLMLYRQSPAKLPGDKDWLSAHVRSHAAMQWLFGSRQSSLPLLWTRYIKMRLSRSRLRDD